MLTLDRDRKFTGLRFILKKVATIRGESRRRRRAGETPILDLLDDDEDLAMFFDLHIESIEATKPTDESRKITAVLLPELDKLAADEDGEKRGTLLKLFLDFIERAVAWLTSPEGQAALAAMIKFITQIITAIVSALGALDAPQILTKSIPESSPLTA